MNAHRLIVFVSTSWFLGACTMVGAPVARAPTPAAERGEPAAPAPTLDDAATGAAGVTSEVVEIALESIGTPYVWGGTGADGFDCSGLIQFAYGQVGILLPRISRAQIGSGSPIVPDPRNLRPGDVLGFTEDGDSATDHVGLYVGGGEFIHSSSGGVRVSKLSNPYWRQRLVAARRIVD